VAGQIVHRKPGRGQFMNSPPETWLATGPWQLNKLTG